jgi:ribosomal protein S18 acetylase RimI-like enzyme
MTAAADSPIEFRALSVEDWQIWRQIRLQALAEAPYAFSTDLADWQGAGDTEERWRSRLSSVPLNLVAYLGNIPAGMASGTAPYDNAVELISMWVAPFARGHGLADGLISAVVAWAARQGVRRVSLVVYRNNARAIALYQKHGFRDDGIGTGDALEMTMQHAIV